MRSSAGDPTRKLKKWWLSMGVTMRAAIIGAVIAGTFAIIAVFIAAFIGRGPPIIVLEPRIQTGTPTSTPVSRTGIPIPKSPTTTRCLAPTPVPVSVPYFNVYTDAGAPDNHFLPTGKMGDLGDIIVNEIWTDKLHSGTSSIKIVYEARGQGDKEGRYKCRRGEFTSGPCEWAGLYWLNPADNFGTVECARFNLTGFKKLTFWARTDTPPTAVKFIVGGVGWGMEESPPFPDSLQPPRGESQWRNLTDTWQPFEIDLTGADLSYVIGGFAWITNWDNNGIIEDKPRTLIFYLDDIRFER